MSFRPLDWSELTPGSSRDPVPGDPHALRIAGRRYSEVAEAISSAADALQRIADNTADNQADSVDELREKSGDVARAIRKAHGRYRDTGAALLRYAAALERAQHRSAQAWLRGMEAVADLRAAERAAAAAPPPGPLDLPPVDRTQEPQQRLDAARRDVQAAVAERDQAAAAATRAIREISDHDGLKDGFWDNHGVKAVKWLADVAGKIATAAGVAALALGWIPVIGQALAAVLGTIALAAALVSLACNLTLVLTGNGSWTDVAFDVLSVATFGLGKIAGVAAKASVRGLGGARRMAAGKLAANTPKGVSARTVLNVHAGKTASMSRNAARKAVRDARAANRPLAHEGYGKALVEDFRNVGGNLSTIRAGARDAFTKQAFRDAYLQGARPASANLLGNKDLADEYVKIAGSSEEVARHALVREMSQKALRHQTLSALGNLGGAASDQAKLQLEARGLVGGGAR